MTTDRPPTPADLAERHGVPGPRAEQTLPGGYLPPPAGRGWRPDETRPWLVERLGDEGVFVGAAHRLAPRDALKLADVIRRDALAVLRDTGEDPPKRPGGAGGLDPARVEALRTAVTLLGGPVTAEQLGTLAGRVVRLAGELEPYLRGAP